MAPRTCPAVTARTITDGDGGAARRPERRAGHRRRRRSPGMAAGGASTAPDGAGRAGRRSRRRIARPVGDPAGAAGPRRRGTTRPSERLRPWRRPRPTGRREPSEAQVRGPARAALSVVVPAYGEGAADRRDRVGLRARRWDRTPRSSWSTTGRPTTPPPQAAGRRRRPGHPPPRQPRQGRGGADRACWPPSGDASCSPTPTCPTPRRSSSCSRRARARGRRGGRQPPPRRHPHPGAGRPGARAERPGLQPVHPAGAARTLRRHPVRAEGLPPRRGAARSSRQTRIDGFAFDVEILWLAGHYGADRSPRCRSSWTAPQGSTVRLANGRRPHGARPDRGSGGGRRWRASTARGPKRGRDRQLTSAREHARRSATAIFKAYDIRGTVPDQLDAELARAHRCRLRRLRRRPRPGAGRAGHAPLGGRAVRRPSPTG